MATTYTASAFNEQALSYAEGVISREMTYELTAALVISDIIKFCKLPKGAVIVDAWLACDDLDTHATPLITLTLRLNDGSAQKNFFSASTVGQAGGLQRATLLAPFESKLDSNSWWVEVLVPAAPATGAATGTIRVVVLYTMDQDHQQT
jgi:hypothetical protein